MIKILHVTFDMRIGGTEQVIKNITQGSDKSQFEMGIVCIESPLGPFAKELQDEGIKFYQLNRQPAFDLSIVTGIRNIIKQQSIDILHCHQYTPWVYGTLAAIFTKTKVIFTEHGRFYPDSSSLKRRMINPILSILTDKITAISKATKQALIDYEFLPKSKIEVIYNGIKPLDVKQNEVDELRTKLGIAKDTFILGTVARLDPIKNHTMMLKAFKLVLEGHPNTTLIIVGDGEERANIESLIAELDMKNEVILPGYIEQPKNYIALLDIFLLSSFSEGTSMTLLEAMSLGKPSVVTDVGGNPEVITHHKEGAVVKSNYHEEFAREINLIKCDLKQKGTMKKNIRTSFDKKYSDLMMLEKYVHSYTGLNNRG